MDEANAKMEIANQFQRIVDCEKKKTYEEGLKRGRFEVFEQLKGVWQDCKYCHNRLVKIKSWEFGEVYFSEDGTPHKCKERENYQPAIVFLSDAQHEMIVAVRIPERRKAATVAKKYIGINPSLTIMGAVPETVATLTQLRSEDSKFFNCVVADRRSNPTTFKAGKELVEWINNHAVEVEG